MWELLKANIVADLAYYRRSRLLLAFMILFLIMTGLSSLPPLFMHSGVQNFNTLRSIFIDVTGYLQFFSAALGLFVISSHLRSRCIKMVFTKPCPPWLWLLGAFLSAVLVSLLLSVLILGSAMLLEAFWHVPVRAGLIFLSGEAFAISIGLIAYLMLLAMMVHPAVAAVCALIFNAGVFYGFQFWARATIHSGNQSPWLGVLEKLFYGLYIAFPMFEPFGAKTSGIHSSLRVMPGEWKYLLYTLAYSLTLSAFCYSTALFALQRKRHT